MSPVIVRLGWIFRLRSRLASAAQLALAGLCSIPPLLACASSEGPEGVGLDPPGGAPGEPHAQLPDAAGTGGDAAGAGSTQPPRAPDAGANAPGIGNDCCTASGGGGCADEAVLACVCAGDALCCSEAYDALCVTQAISRCGVTCEARAPESDCCSPSGAPSCTLPEVAACVCAIDAFCCIGRFDDNCAALAQSACSLTCNAEPPRP